MNQRVSRRGFLGVMGGVAVLPAVAGGAVRVGGLAGASAAEIIASSPSVAAVANVSGATSHFSAGTPFDTFVRWCDRMGFADDSRPAYTGEAPLDPGSVQTCPVCIRCGGAGGDEPLRDVSDELVCVECLTYGESLADDEARGLRELADLISAEGEAEARAFVTLHEDFEAIGEDRWARAAAMKAPRAS